MSATWPLAARAQQSGKLPTIGFLGSGTPAVQSLWVAAFVKRLRELGWIDGRNIAIEYRWAEGSSNRAAKMIRDTLGIESDDVANYCFPKEWPANREHRANIVEWLQTEARFKGGRG